MMNGYNIEPDDIETLFHRLFDEAESGGYHLNPDIEATKELVKGLLINEKRYGYWACPCRLADGIKEKDLDIICPCDYRDPDLYEYGVCYCSLYVSGAVVKGEKNIEPIPERRFQESEKSDGNKKGRMDISSDKLKYPIWRCRVCGYLCARDNPPETCPICKAKKERFEILAD
jgi:ferredoxin-thioredoxin reductase catalytic subunit